MISHLTPCFIWWPLPGLNGGPSDYESELYSNKNKDIQLNQTHSISYIVEKYCIVLRCAAILLPLIRFNGLS